MVTFSSSIDRGNEGIDQQAYEYAIKFVNPKDLLKAIESIGLLHATNRDDLSRHAQQFAAIYADLQVK